MSKTLMISLFIVAVLIGFYIDYQKDRKTYGDQGKSFLYLMAIGLVAFTAVYYAVVLVESMMR
jgi:hypothetical protein